MLRYFAPRRRQDRDAELIEQARESFARDAHDLVGYWLHLAAIRAELARQKAGASLQEDLAELVAAVQCAADDLRDLTKAYRRITLHEEAARAELQLTAMGLTCILTLPEEEPDPELSAFFGTVVREGITNVLRHSDATLCTITLTSTHDRHRLTIENDAPRPHVTPGFGLGNLTWRATQLAGQVTANCENGTFRLTAEVPSAFLTIDR